MESTTNSRFCQLSQQLFGECIIENGFDIPNRPNLDIGNCVQSNSLLNCKKGLRKLKNLKPSSTPCHCLICHVELESPPVRNKNSQYSQNLTKFLDIISQISVKKNNGLMVADDEVPDHWIKKTTCVPPMCGSCYGATKLFVSAWNDLKKLEEFVFELKLKSKITCAIKLSTRIADEDGIITNDSVDFDNIRRFIVGGGDSNSTNSNQPLLLNKNPASKRRKMTVARGKRMKLNAANTSVSVQQITSEVEASPLSFNDSLKHDEAIHASQTEDVHNLTPLQNTKFDTEPYSDDGSNHEENFDELDPVFIPDNMTEGFMDNEDIDHINIGETFEIHDVKISTEEYQNSLLAEERDVNLLEDEDTQNVIANDEMLRDSDTKRGDELEQTPTDQVTADKKMCTNLPKSEEDIHLGTNSSKPNLPKDLKSWRARKKLNALYPPDLTKRQIILIHKQLLPARLAMRDEARSSKQVPRVARRRAIKFLQSNQTKDINNPEAILKQPMEKLCQSPYAAQWCELKEKYPGKSFKEIHEIEKEKKVQELRLLNAVPQRSGNSSSGWRQCKLLYKKLDANRTLYRNIEIRKLDNGTFECSSCNPSSSYKYFGSAVKHINIAHIDLSNSYECEHCGKKFYHHHLYKTHIRVRHGGDKYQCHLCGLFLVTHAARYSHIKAVHEQVKPHKCEYCEKAFFRIKDLTIHVRRHTGERPFVCHVCADAFIEKQSMKNIQKLLRMLLIRRYKSNYKLNQ